MGSTAGALPLSVGSHRGRPETLAWTRAVSDGPRLPRAAVGRRCPPTTRCSRRFESHRRGLHRRPRTSAPVGAGGRHRHADVRRLESGSRHLERISSRGHRSSTRPHADRRRAALVTRHRHCRRTRQRGGRRDGTRVWRGHVQRDTEVSCRTLDLGTTVPTRSVGYEDHQSTKHHEPLSQQHGAGRLQEGRQTHSPAIIVRLDEGGWRDRYGSRVMVPSSSRSKRTRQGGSFGTRRAPRDDALGGLAQDFA